MSREEEAEEVVFFLRRFAAEVFTTNEEESQRNDKRQRRGGGSTRAAEQDGFKLGKLKQVCKYLFAANPALTPHIARVLGTTVKHATPEQLLEDIEALVMGEWATPQDVLVDTFSMRTKYADGVSEEEKEGRLATSGFGKDIVRM